jgi:hypothetical protein
MPKKDQANEEERYGAPADALSSDAYPESLSRDAAEYVLVDRVTDEGFRYQEQVHKGEAEVSVNQKGVHEAHPEENRPALGVKPVYANEKGK